MINLAKGQGINLSKTATMNESMKKISIGLDWGMIEHKGFMGFGGSKEAVDLDASAYILDENKRVIEVVYYGDKVSSKGLVKHSGDDRSGDSSDDDKDNEIIVCNLAEMVQAKYVVFGLTSYSGQDFGQLPYVRIRAYEGNSNTPSNSQVLAKMELSKDSSFDGKKSMIMGAAIKENNEWIFKAIGEPVSISGVKAVASIVSDYI